MTRKRYLRELAAAWSMDRGETYDSLLAAQILDSLAMAQLIVFLESTYHVEFDTEELTPDNLDSVDAIAAFLERKGVPASL